MSQTPTKNKINLKRADPEREAQAAFELDAMQDLGKMAIYCRHHPTGILFTTQRPREIHVGERVMIQRNTKMKQHWRL